MWKNTFIFAPNVSGVIAKDITPVPDILLLSRGLPTGFLSSHLTNNNTLNTARKIWFNFLIDLQK
jgi:hypothetical protein